MSYYFDRITILVPVVTESEGSLGRDLTIKILHGVTCQKKLAFIKPKFGLRLYSLEISLHNFMKSSRL
jgi:hypothetical protein